MVASGHAVDMPKYALLSSASLRRGFFMPANSAISKLFGSLEIPRISPGVSLGVPLILM